jgi:hypothetical protein
MTKNQAKALIGTTYTTPADGTGTVTDAYTNKGQTFITVTIPGAGFNGSTLKCAVRV